MYRARGTGGGPEAFAPGPSSVSENMTVFDVPSLISAIRTRLLRWNVPLNGCHS